MREEADIARRQRDRMVRGAAGGTKRGGRVWRHRKQVARRVETGSEWSGECAEGEGRWGEGKNTWGEDQHVEG